MSIDWQCESLESALEIQIPSAQRGLRNISQRQWIAFLAGKLFIEITFIFPALSTFLSSGKKNSREDSFESKASRRKYFLCDEKSIRVEKAKRDERASEVDVQLHVKYQRTQFWGWSELWNEREKLSVNILKFNSDDF